MKHRIVLFLLLTSMVSLRAAVAPITDGEGIWNVVTRIGIEVDTLDTKALICDEFITDADIGAGGTYEITTSNRHYCLQENIDFTTGAAITISGSCIILDLNDRYIDGGDNAGTIAVQLKDGAHNIEIRNGTIKNVVVNAIADEQNDAPVGVLNENIRIRNIKCIDSAQGDNVIELASDGFEMSDCSFIDCGSIQAQGAGVVSRMIFDFVDYAGGAGETITFGGSSVEAVRSVVIEDSIITGSFDTSSLNVFVENVENLAMRNCYLGSLGDAPSIEFENIVNLYVGDTTVANCATGFLIQASDTSFEMESAVFERCVVADSAAYGYQVDSTASGRTVSNVKFIDSQVLNAGTSGFFINGAAGTINNIVFKDCCAQGCVDSGFLVGRSFGIVDSLTFESCFAQDNGGDGFTFAGTDTGSFTNITFHNCIAQNNTGGATLDVGGAADGDGFAIGSSATGGTGTFENLYFEDCIAQSNGGDGFEFIATTTDIKMFGCCAMNNIGVGVNNLALDKNFVFGNVSLQNTGGDLVGVTDPAKRPRYSYAGSLMGAGRWVNVRT